MKTIATTGIFLLPPTTIVTCSAFQHKLLVPTESRRPPVSLRVTADADLPSQDAAGDDDDTPIIKSTVKIDDGGSDLTQRFNYKMQALLGNFDPQIGDDTEADGQGNIISALTNFPARFAFTVVGRTNGDDEAKQNYIEQVKRIVGEASGSANTLECRVTPRGSNFVRVSVEVTVESGAIINTIYDELSNLEATVMKY
jgi:putative lipoic acid-binding regulatory protein